MKALVLMLVLQSAAIAQTQTPSLAEAAKQERERRQNLSPTRVVTDQSIRDLTVPPISDLVAKSPDKAEPKSDQKTSEKPKSEADNAPHDEAWWRNAFQKARDEVKRTDDRVNVLQLDLNKLNTEFLRRSDIYDREQQLGPQVNAKRNELATAQSEADRAKEKLASLEEDLRRAGAPPGWAR